MPVGRLSGNSNLNHPSGCPHLFSQQSMVLHARKLEFVHRADEESALREPWCFNLVKQLPMFARGIGGVRTEKAAPPAR
jgi:hypothetical protein